MPRTDQNLVVLTGGRVGGWLDQMELRLKSASVEVEIEVEVEAELGNDILFFAKKIHILNLRSSRIFVCVAE